jgi:hypothetical protein
MLPGELHEAAFRRYCEEQSLTFVGLAQAMSASGQDPQGLEAKPASAVAESDAPNPPSEQSS